MDLNFWAAGKNYLQGEQVHQGPYYVSQSSSMMFRTSADQRGDTAPFSLNLVMEEGKTNAENVFTSELTF